jgi:hypothetical protein
MLPAFFFYKMKKVVALILVSLTLLVFFLIINLGPVNSEDAFLISEQNSTYKNNDSIMASSPKDDVPVQAEPHYKVSAVSPDKIPVQAYSDAITNTGGRNATLSNPNSASIGSASSPNADQANKVSPSKPKVDMEILEIVIPRGARLPAAILHSPNNLSPQQAEVLDRISEEFLNSVMPETSESKESLEKIDSKLWSKSLNDANEKFRAVFGVDAFNAVTMQAAKEALADKP